MFEGLCLRPPAFTVFRFRAYGCSVSERGLDMGSTEKRAGGA